MDYESWTRQTLGDRLRRHLEEQGMSLRRFARELEPLARKRRVSAPSHSQLSRIASNRSGVSDPLLELLADAFGVSVEALPEYRLLRLREQLNPARNRRAVPDFLQLEQLVLAYGSDDLAAALLLRELNERANA